jgi:YesN/AraC family two-component response regulator
MDGISFLSRARDICPRTVRMMLTGFADVKLAVSAVNVCNVFRLLTKPCPKKSIVDALDEAIEIHFKSTMESNGSVMNTIYAQSCENYSDFDDIVASRYTSTDKMSSRKMTSSDEIPLTWENELGVILSQLGRDDQQRHLAKQAITNRRIMYGERSIPNHTASDADLGGYLMQVERLVEIGCHHGGNNCWASSYTEARSRIQKLALEYNKFRNNGMLAAEALFHLSADEGSYKLLVVLAQAVRLYAGHVLRKISIAELESGMVLESNLLTARGLLLLSKGTRISNTMIRRLYEVDRNFKVVEPIMVRMPRAATYEDSVN